MKPTNMKVGDRWWHDDETFHLGKYFDVKYKTGKSGFYIKWEKGNAYEASTDPSTWIGNYRLDETQEVIKILNEYTD
jgi:hypothetical protein